MDIQEGIMRNFAAFLVLVFLGLASGLAGGQPSQGAGRQAILDYQLTEAKANHLIAAIPQMTKYLMSLPDVRERLARSAKMTPAERLAQLENDPAAMAILKQHELTARDYMVGVPTLRMALMAAQGAADSPNVVASPANVAFANANLAQLKPKLDAADGGAGK
jgi:hypothetical protein